MVRLDRRTLPEWQRLRVAAQQARSELGPAIAEALANDLLDCHKILEDPHASVDQLRVAQGTLIGLRKGTMVIEGILKRAERVLARRGAEEEPDA